MQFLIIVKKIMTKRKSCNIYLK